MLSKNLIAAAGNAGAESVYVEDVFSTYLYTGNGSTQTITNGIDLAGEGGMVWIKARSFNQQHVLTDTVRGATKTLASNTVAAEVTDATHLTSFTSSGFAVGSGNEVNQNNESFVSWAFRKTEKFFDVFTYTGNGVNNRVLSHNLGSIPGCIIIKKRSQASSIGWGVYHRSSGNLALNSTAAQNASFAYDIQNPTSTTFTVSAYTDLNANGQTYVAYLFAHDAGGFGASGSDNVISCGSFTTNGGGTASVTLGYEPAWLLCKRSDSSTGGRWYLVDTMRGWFNQASGSNISYLEANTSSAETTSSYNGWNPTATGFDFIDFASATYIYIAIRRPMKTPEAGTEVYTGVAYDGVDPGTGDFVKSVGFPVDLMFCRRRNDTVNFGAAATAAVLTRLTGGPNTSSTLGSTPLLGTLSSDAETTTSTGLYKFNSTSFTINSNSGALAYAQSGVDDFTYIAHCLKRASGFFDVVCYTGNATDNRAITHNLGVAPELLITKCRNSTYNWEVYQPSLGAYSSNASRTLRLNLSSSTSDSGLYKTDSLAASQYLVSADNSINGTSLNYVAYLFATLAGVSKVGNYTGNGSNQTINCGFSTGARFVLIKRTDSTGDWYVWDSARGIVAGDDPHLSLNSTAAEVTTDDTIDPASSGFIVNQLSATNVNVSSATYIYLAIA